MRGFTIIELLLVIAIAVILLVIVLSGFSNLRQSSDFTLAVDEAVSFLQEARAKTLSSENDSVYGVHFETSQFVLFTGDTYNAASASNKVRALPSSVEISSFLLTGGGDAVVFKRLTGETATYGTITFRRTDDPSITKTIEVVSTGLAGVQ
ncbi:MAG: hypothetical protein A3J55_03640 [Candidatus Ryanbacteria bacterium RIFCSPHIGHO2_02_FULL_45_17b]|uniref:General secretion pathway GspH domain-containing protein n=1 Tax=Candidatus Ryanbacteria bacterium RIFCSPHIGHO2_01_FULL_45_22 TaxID=1802114 RepID=A0A1G2G3E1_9BACT|nr:MAG: hypothetical protein A2719_04835 [Candidatus Ryanbacteria bacterium RIFCSPHIGHO2_01_FULL_45_22]OGZ47549.1 MAG: hypothetical protein A3J55_03640 [Candidatus Ryanbacteria bacterium RIFCSPHIGHO2_02_FULL_45_17b]